jgi:uncharacterized membrane protein
MDKSINSKPWYKKWWIWVAVVVVLSVIGYVTNPDSANKSNSDSATSNETPAPKQWTKVSELTGDLKEKSGDVFAVAGGNLRIKYTVNTTSDSGTAMLYLLPEGSTTTKNGKGELDVAVQDITTIGTKSGEKVLQKSQGNYYLYINTSSIKDYSITVEEQK